MNLTPTPKERDERGLLSKRETEVMMLVVDGKTNKQAADALKVSIKTVEAHRAHVMTKLRLKNAVALTRWAIRQNIIIP